MVGGCDVMLLPPPIFSTRKSVCGHVRCVTSVVVRESVHGCVRLIECECECTVTVCTNACVPLMCRVRLCPHDWVWRGICVGVRPWVHAFVCKHMLGGYVKNKHISTVILKVR